MISHGSQLDALVHHPVIITATACAAKFFRTAKFAADRAGGRATRDGRSSPGQRASGGTRCGERLDRGASCVAVAESQVIVMSRAV